MVRVKDSTPGAALGAALPGIELILFQNAPSPA